MAKPDPVPRCCKCFQPKATEPLFGLIDILICNACRYKVMEIVAFMEYHGLAFMRDMLTPETGEVTEVQVNSPNGTGAPQSDVKTPVKPKAPAKG